MASTIKLPSGAKTYKCTSSPEMIVHFRCLWINKVYYSPDGAGFVQWEDRVAINPEIKKRHGSPEQMLSKKKTVIVWGRKRFKLVENPDEIEIVTIPVKRSPWFLFKLNKHFVYISYDENDGTIGSLKLFFGSPNELHELPILSVQISPEGAFVIKSHLVLQDETGQDGVMSKLECYL